MKIFIDGASKGNPGKAGIGVVIQSHDGSVIQTYKEYIGYATNNQAEYLALIKGLDLASKRGAVNLEVYSDSELLIRQMNGEYKVRNPHLRKLYGQVKNLEKGFKKITYRHISRKQNYLADKLANEAIYSSNH
jgi:ribonuclease HI